MREFVEQLAEDYTQHPDYATIVTALAQGVKRSTKLIIDSLGIKTELSSLPSWDEYTMLKRKMFHGFTSIMLYRLLFPRRYRRLYRAYIDAQEKIQQELLTRVLDNGARICRTVDSSDM